MLRRKTSTLAVVTLLGIAGIVASLFGFQEERFDLTVRNDFFSGMMGDGAALERGMKKCEEILAKNPNHPEALVWHGGGLYFMAGQAFQQGDQQKGIDLLARGAQEMDRAVELDPRNIGVRIPRGATYITASRFMPAEFSRPVLEKGVSDFQATYDLQKDELPSMGEHPRGELLFGLAEGYGRLGETAKAEEFFGRIQKDLKGSVYARRAAVWLEKRALPPEETGCVGCHVN